VFTREDGAPLRPEFLTREFHRLSDLAGLRRIRLHDLRHFAVSMYAAAGGVADDDCPATGTPGCWRPTSTCSGGTAARRLH
jgi:integrase